MAHSAESSPIASLLAASWVHAKLFAFVCVSLGMFLLCLCCLPTAARGYVVRAVLGLRMQSQGAKIATPLPPDAQHQIRETALSTEQIRSALKQVGPPPRVNRVSSEVFPTLDEIEFVRKRLTTAPLKGDAFSETRFALSFTGLDSAWSVALVDQLANQWVATLEERATAEPKAAVTSALHSKRDTARQKEQEARQALDEFLSRHFDALNRSGKQALESQARKEANSKVPAEPSPRINPKWQSLREQLATLTAERERILLDRTAEHPQAVEVAAKIEALRRQLEQTPKFLAEEDSALSVKDRRISSIQPAQFAAADSPPGREYEQLLGDLRRAREERQAAEQAVEVAARSKDLSAAGASVVRGRVVATAHLAQTLREPPSVSRLTLLALASIFVGACVAALIRIPQAIKVYTSLTQIENDLSLPVIGVVSPASRSTAVLSR